MKMPWLAPLASLAFPVPPRLLAFLALLLPPAFPVPRLPLALQLPPVPPRLLVLLQVTKTNKEGVRKSAFLVFRGKLEQSTLPECLHRFTTRLSHCKSSGQQR